MLGGSIVAGELLDVTMVSCVVIVLDTVEENTVCVVFSETETTVVAGGGNTADDVDVDVTVNPDRVVDTVVTRDDGT